MAPRLSPSKGSKPDKLMRDALMLALNREAANAEGVPTKKLHLIAEKLTDLAVSGNIQAIKEIGDRVDGKHTQPIGGDPDNPFLGQMAAAAQSCREKLERIFQAKTGFERAAAENMPEPRGSA